MVVCQRTIHWKCSSSASVCDYSARHYFMLILYNYYENVVLVLAAKNNNYATLISRETGSRCHPTWWRVSTRKIANREKLSNVGVWKIGKRRDIYHTYKDLPRSGRPRLFTEREERKIVRLVKSGKCETATEVQSHLRTEEDLHVSTNTLRRAFRRNDLVARVKRKKPLLTRAHRRRRLAFAREHKDWMPEDWKCVVWSDESKFQLFNSDGRQWCWKRLGEPLNDRSVKPTVKHGGGNLMVWGCVTSKGVGYLCRIDGGWMESCIERF